jgi:hypothetical protein
MKSAIPSWSDILKYASNVAAEGEKRKIEPIHLAEKKRAEAAVAGDLNKARLWRDVWVYFMTKKYVMQNKQIP